MIQTDVRHVGTGVPLTLGDAAEVFVEHHTKTLSPSYRIWLRKKLAHLINHLGHDARIDKVTIFDLDVWYSTVTERRDWSDDYKAGHATAVKKFFSWLGERRVIQSDPAALLRPVTVAEKPPKAISDAAARCLLRLAAANPRDYAIIRFLLFTGARAHEVTGLTYDRLFLPDRYAILEGKGRRGAKQYRTVIFDPITQQAIQTYLDESFRGRGPYIFVSEKIGDEGAPLSPNALRLMINRLKDGLKAEGIREPVSPHRLRHYWATRALRLGANPTMVQDMMGHRDFSTTKRYTKFMPDQLRESYDKFFSGTL